MKLRSAVITAVLCLFSVLAVAQRETGTIGGTVTDTTGAIVANSKITIKSTTTGAVRTVSVNPSGMYSVTDLQPGLYDITVEGPGFAAFHGRVEVTVGSSSTFNAALRIGGKMETIEVTADMGAAKVNVDNQTISNTITAKEVVDLPSLTRNPYDFVKTSGNVTEGAYGANGMLTSRGAGVSINGQRAASTDLLLDGSENVDIFGAGVGQAVPLDSVQELSVLTSNFTADYGRAGGGVVNVATKAGTNAFHGTGYEFNRVSALAANTPDNNANGLPKGVFTRNQFGYSFGGPIKKDKLFFFSSTEWTRIRSDQQQILLVPDAAFVGASNANTQSFFSSLGTLRPGLTQLGTITQAQVANSIDPTHVATGSFFSLPGTTPVFDKVSYGVATDAGAGLPQNTYSMVHRVDYNFSDKTNMYARYAYSNEADFAGTVNTSPYAGYDTGQSIRNHNALLSMTHVFTPAIVSESKLAFNRFSTVQPLAAAPVGPTLFFTGTTAMSITGTTVELPGYSATTPGNALPFGGPQNLIQMSQDLSWAKGKHQFRFGGAYINMHDNRTFGAYEEAVENLSSGSKIAAFNNFVDGTLHDFQAAINPQGKFPCPRNPSTGALTTDPTQLANCTITLPVGPPNFSRSNRFNDGSIYAQDEWKIRHNLTLNLGLRWEYFGTQHDANPKLDSNFYFGSGSTFFDQIRNGAMQLTPQSSMGKLWNPGGGFAPRVGFAWDPFGDSKTSIRGGYGLSYERNFGNVTFNVIQNPSNYLVLDLTPSAGSPLAITPNNSGPMAGTGSTPLPRSTGRIVDPNIPTAYTEFWSFSAQREVARNTLLALEYTGSNGIHLYDISDINQVGSGGVYEGDPNPLNRLDPQYGNLNYRSARGFSRYNALITSLKSSNLFNKGLTLNLNYTWSHAIDNLSTTFSESTNNANLGYLDPFNPGLDKGNADFDVRHRFVASAIWDVPYFKSAQNPILRQTLGGWSFAPIFTAYTGMPYTIYDCTNAFFDRCPRLFTNSIAATDGSVGTAVAPNVYNWMTVPTSAFAAGTSYADPITGTGEFPTCTGALGQGCAWPSTMTGRNRFRGPGFWNADMGIYKKFKLSERFNLQLRGEMYDMFNHHPFAMIGSNNDASSATSMTVKQLGNRNVQLGAKIIF
jgi:outer membrane receptor protein involved in Fe transport